MEVCPETERIALEDPATVCDGAFEIGESFEVLVGERLVDSSVLYQFAKLMHSDAFFYTQREITEELLKLSAVLAS